jgi:hypothetical protein
MKEQRTASILGRVPAILAVTAASYGLPPPAQRRSNMGSLASVRGRITRAHPTNQRFLSQH